jgi:hypothetical protein
MMVIVEVLFVVVNGRPPGPHGTERPYEEYTYPPGKHGQIIATTSIIMAPETVA